MKTTSGASIAMKPLGNPSSVIGGGMGVAPMTQVQKPPAAAPRSASVMTPLKPVRAVAATIAQELSLERGSTRSSSSNGNGNGNGSSMSTPASLMTIDADVISLPSTSASAWSADMQPIPVDYPTDEGYAWSSEGYNTYQRTFDTWSFITVFRSRLWLLEQKWAYVGGFTEAKKKSAATSIAKYLLESILNLGPTFIKLGQLSSTRADLFPAEFVAELSNLQDRVPAFSAEKAIAIIEQDLGQPINKLFKAFSPKPIAAASLGQVHRAVLWTGEEVVVKVQRPALKQLFDIDLNNMKILAEGLDKNDENADFKGIYQECSQVLYEEIDYINEGRNADRFRRNFRDTPWVVAPKVYWQFCSPRVLTLEYLPGVKISDKARLTTMGLDSELIAKRATEAYLIQILRHGFFHADPHPGNLAVDFGPSGEGRLVYYDYGMMGEIPGNVRQTMLDMFYGIYKKDTGAVIKCLVDLGVVRSGGDQLSVRRSIAYFLDNINKQAERKETISAIGEDLFAIALDQPFRFPATFTFVLRAFSTLEGIGKSLNPEYNFATVAQPYAQELLDLQGGKTTSQLLIDQVRSQASELGQQAAAMPSRIARVDATMTALEGGDLKLRVRVLEAERADRRASVMQTITVYSVAAVGLLDVGVQLTLAEITNPANAALAAAVGFSVAIVLAFRRIASMDKFEKEIRQG